MISRIILNSLTFRWENVLRHVVFLTETWLTSEHNHVTALVKTYGYELLHSIRKDRLKDTGGEVGVLIKLKIRRKKLRCKKYSSFEYTMVKLYLLNKKSITLICIYRLLFVSAKTFLDDIKYLFESMVTKNENFVLAGDVNLHTETDNSYAGRFNNLMDTFNLVQHITVPTHKMGHTLDIVATFNNNPSITSIKVCQDLSA